MDISKGISLTTNMSRSIADMNLSPVKVTDDFARRLREIDEGARKAEAIERGEIRFVADNDPENAVQTVMKGNQVVATIYKSGVVTISGEFAGHIGNLSLPESGAMRAKVIAEAVGGKIVDVSPDSRSSKFPFSTIV
ncbi:hypothetical protein [Pseudomonas sp. FP198]|uniref:hypothetical protein n=1 Tax=Pseudomonas sp. FP198 TaxID=2954084 RepID=UPI0027374F1C|nr:hypothetical protein [Pseudomonas sp. FP198]WLG93800.1 hypothetical protein PSH78_15395 [Pseudomonas sp. FP198]